MGGNSGANNTIVFRVLVQHLEYGLVGGFNPVEKYARQNGFIFPKVRDENKKYLSCHHRSFDSRKLVNKYLGKS